MLNQSQFKKCLGSLVIVMNLISSSASASEIDLNRIFFESSQATPLPGYLLIAHYYSEDQSLFVAKNKKMDDSYIIFELNEDTEIGTTLFKAVEFEDDKLLLRDDKGISYSVAFENKRRERDTQISTAEESFRSDWSDKNFTDDKAALVKFKNIAIKIGVPNFIASQFISLPKPGRTFGGRAGWLLDKTVPRLLLLASPFKANDLIVSRDGINTHQLDELEPHLSEKPENSYFDVEIQRGGELKMLRIRL